MLLTIPPCTGRSLENYPAPGVNGAEVGKPQSSLLLPEVLGAWKASSQGADPLVLLFPSPRQLREDRWEPKPYTGSRPLPSPDISN